MALTWLLKIKIITNVVIYLFLIISNSVLMCAYLFVALLLLNNQYELLLSRIRIALLYIFRGTVPRRGKISLRGTFYHAEVLFKSKGEAYIQRRRGEQKVPQVFLPHICILYHCALQSCRAAST
jgi:hypothetical protein